MSKQDWYNLGDEINDIVQEAIDSQNFSRLNQTINQTLGRTMDAAMEGMRRAGRAMENAQDVTRRHYHTTDTEVPFGQRWTSPAVPKQEVLYRKTTGDNILGSAMTIVGGVTTFGLALATFIVLGVSAATGIFTDGVIVSIVVMAPLLAVFSVLLKAGSNILGRIKRFKTYCRVLGGRTYCDIKELTQAVGKNKTFVVKDLRKMIEKGMFLQGHLDKKNTCLMVSNESYQQYLEAEKQLQLRRQAEKEQQKKEKQQAKAHPDKDGSYSPEVQAILEKGRYYVQMLKECNDAIPGEVISNKISRTELLTAKIFQCVEQDPSVVDDLKKLMEYYLPTTIKLLKAYEQLDAQPVQGENIKNSKKEIEDSLDTINQAFEQLLDSLFEETAWDVSADISVLKTMLAQEGLTGKDFKM